MAVNINVPSQVKTYANLAAFPATGALKTIYIAEDTNKTYRWTGSVYVEVSASAASGITIGSTAITSGVVGRVLFEGAGNVVQESSSLFWDATNNRLGIGTSTPATLLNVSGNYAGTTDALVPQLLFENTNNTSSAYLAAIIRTRISTGYVGNFPELWIQSTRDASNVGITMIRTVSNHPLSFHTNDLERARIFANGNIGINTTTDAGFKLDVNGTARATSFTASPALVSAWANSAVFARFGHTSFNGSTSFGFIQTNAGDCYVNGPNLYLSGGSAIRLEANGSERMRVFGSGNVGINTTTDAGLRLNVNGTAWVQDILYVSNQGVGTTTAFIGGKVVIGSELTNAGYAVKIRSTNTGVAGMYLRGGGGSGYPVMFCQDYNGTTSTTFMVSEIGSVSIGIDSVNASAKLQVDSTTQGFLPPRMTTTQKNAIATPAAGLVVYDTTLNKLCVYTTAWETVTSL